MSAMFIGQTFQVVLTTFIIAQLTTFTSLPDMWSPVLTFLSAAGVLGVLVMAPVCQLFPSTLSTVHPAGFLEHVPLMQTVVATSLLIENCGIAHCVHVLVHKVDAFIASHTSSSSSSSSSSPRPNDSDAFWKTPYTAFKVILSSIMLVFSVVLVLLRVSLTDDALAAAGNLVMLLTALMIIFACEGVKVALVLKATLPISIYKSEDGPLELYHLLQEASTVSVDFGAIPTPSSLHHSSSSSGSGSGSGSTHRGLQRFLVGRQLIVVPVGFLLARLCTGFATVPAVMVVSCLAQLFPQILAQRHALLFLNFPGVYHLVYVSLVLEKTGVAEMALVLTEGMIGLVEGVWQRARPKGYSIPVCATAGESKDENGMNELL